MLDRLRAWLGPIVIADLARVAERAGDRRAVGAVAVGAAAALGALPVAPDTLRATTIALAPPRARDINAAAFDLGRALA
jgi:Pyruvate/2-oxoacid:ferredoxin oxidoreductase gamma subunit